MTCPFVPVKSMYSCVFILIKKTERIEHCKQCYLIGLAIHTSLVRTHSSFYLLLGMLFQPTKDPHHADNH